METLQLLRPLWLLALPLPALVIYFLSKSRTEETPWTSVVDAHLLQHLQVSFGGKERRLPLLSLGLAWLLMILALAGPVWQRVPPLEFKPVVAPLVIALDLSRSMNTRDLHPTRLKVAQAKVSELLRQLSQRPVALAVFSVKAHSVMPFTEDRELLHEIVPRLSTDLMPAAGSRLSSVFPFVEQMFNAYGATAGDLLLVTDSADETSFTAAENMHQSGFRVSILAVGTVQGSYVTDKETGYLLTAKGAVSTALDKQALQRVARLGGGRFALAAKDNSDVSMLIGGFGRPEMAGAERQAGRGEVWREGGPWLIVLLLPLLLSLFRSGSLPTLIVAVGLSTSHVEASEWEWLWLNADQQGEKLLHQGDVKGAQKRFHHPLWRGVAQYRRGDYGAAVRSFHRDESALGHFNRGNSLVHLGRLKEAVAAYDKALRLVPGFEDAAFNRRLVLQSLKRGEKNMVAHDRGMADKGDNKQKRKKITHEASKTAEDMLDAPRQEDFEWPQGKGGQDLANIGSLGGGAILSRGGQDSGARQSSSVGEGLMEGKEDNETGGDQVARRGSAGEAGQDDGVQKEIVQSHMPKESQRSTPVPGVDDRKGLKETQRMQTGEASGTSRERQTDKRKATDIRENASDPTEVAAALAEERNEGKGHAGDEVVQAMRQWLGTIEDDPTGLLREKFKREYRRDPPATPTEAPW